MLRQSGVRRPWEIFWQLLEEGADCEAKREQLCLGLTKHSVRSLVCARIMHTEQAV